MSGVNLTSDSDSCSTQQEATIDTVSVLYLSSNYLAINKHFDIRINSDDPSHLVTVEHQLRKKYPELIDSSVTHSFRFQHRLDHATSGVLCVSLNKTAADKFRKVIERRQSVKHYLALVRGHMTSPAPSSIQHINISIGRDTSVTDFHKMCLSDNPACDKPRSAYTGLVVLQHGTYDGQPASKILLIPYTGRTHQLRVVCQYCGHLIVGDYTYSNRTDVTPYRMMLHAYRLIVPIPGETLDIMTPDPFTPDIDSMWIPSHTFLTYEEFLCLEAEHKTQNDCCL